MTSLISVDPGGVHVGVAHFIDTTPPSGRWTCDSATEMEPREFEDWLACILRSHPPTYLVVETFMLFGDKALAQVGSEMETSQLIGVIKYLHRTVAPHTTLQFQAPGIKVPTRRILDARGVRLKADIDGVPLDHASDAELHGHYYINKRLDMITEDPDA